MNNHNYIRPDYDIIAAIGFFDFFLVNSDIPMIINSLLGSIQKLEYD